MKQITRFHILSTPLIRGLLAVTGIVFLLNMLPFLEIPLLLIQSFAAALTDSVTGWSSDSDFSDFTQVTHRAAVAGTIIMILTVALIAVGICVLMYRRRVYIAHYTNIKVEHIRRSKIKISLLIFILILLTSLFIMDKGWMALSLWNQN